MRSVTVDVPDDDGCEDHVRRVAAMLRDGLNIATIPIPSALGFEHMGEVGTLVAETQAKLEAKAAVVALRN